MEEIKRHFADLFSGPFKMPTDEEMQRMEYEAREKKIQDIIVQRQERLKSSGVINHITKTMAFRIVRNKADDTKFLSTVKKWIANRDSKISFFVMFGTVGRGKTVASAYWLSRMRGLYTQARQLERVFAAQYGPYIEEQDRILNTKNLVIDDLGLEQNPQTFCGSLVEIIDYRQGSNKKTILTTNLTRKQFNDRYPDPRLHSRLSRCVFVGDSGPDMRREK